jgi:APA family basic amino acid/polyamine antiporter
MAKDGLFFKWLDYIHPRFRTPSRAILAHCFWSAVILLTRKTFETIASGLVFAILIFYALTALTLFKLRKKDPGKKDIFRVPLYPILPGLYFAGILILLVLRVCSEWKNSLIDLAFIASGLPFSIIWCRKKGRKKRQLESE